MTNPAHRITSTCPECHPAFGMCPECHEATRPPVPAPEPWTPGHDLGCYCDTCTDAEWAEYEVWCSTPEGAAHEASVARAEIYAEFGMGYVTSGGNAEDVSAAFNQHYAGQF
jgi:hypothetical protein